MYGAVFYPETGFNGFLHSEYLTRIEESYFLQFITLYVALDFDFFLETSVNEISGRYVEFEPEFYIRIGGDWVG